MSWNSSNWNASNWHQNNWWLGGSIASSGGAFIVVAGPAVASGYTLSPDFGVSILVDANATYATGYTYDPTTRIIVLPNVSIVSGSTNTPTLSLGSTIAVGTQIASGRTRDPRFPGVGLPSQYTGTTDILDSYPSLRKAILNSGNEQNTSIVIAGQIGLKDGDILIYLGNGQWRRR